MPFQQIHYSHHIFLTLSKRGLCNTFILATTHSSLIHFHFFLLWPYLGPYLLSSSRHWRKTGKRHENEVSQQFLSSTQALVRGDQGTHPSQMWMSPRPPNNRLVSKLSPPPENESLGKTTPQIKHFREKTSHSQLPHTSVERQQSTQGTVLSQFYFPYKMTTAFSTAESNTSDETVAFTGKTFSLISESHNCKSFSWVKYMHSALLCTVALLLICSLTRTHWQQ